MKEERGRVWVKDGARAGMGEGWSEGWSEVGYG